MTKVLDRAIRQQMIRADLARQCGRAEELVAEATAALGDNRPTHARAAVDEARTRLERIATVLTVMDRLDD